MANKGWFLYADDEKLDESFRIAMQELLPPGRKIAVTGDFRRKCEVLQSLDVIAEASVDELVTAIAQINTLLIEPGSSPLQAKHEYRLPFRFFPTDPQSFSRQLLPTPGAETHMRQLHALPMALQFHALDHKEAI